MKLLILTDLEGVGGVVRSDQTKIKTSASEENYFYYQDGRRLLTGEVNAAVQGALDGGATEIVVWDGHGRGFNFVIEDLHPGAEYVIGGGTRQWFPVDASYDRWRLSGATDGGDAQCGARTHAELRRRVLLGQWRGDGRDRPGRRACRHL